MDDAPDILPARRKNGAPVWLMTFADLMALLFALFVLILSFSDIDSDSFKRNAGPIAEAFNKPKPIFTRETKRGTPTTLFAPPKPFSTQPSVSATSTADLINQQRTSLVSQVRSIIQFELSIGLVELEVKNHVIIMRFPGRTTFSAGSASITSEIVPTIDRVADILTRTEGNIFVSGHTDSTPISSHRYRSNWDLSSARAVSVVHRLLRHPKLAPNRISAVGYADTKPIVSTTGSADVSRSRRVEIKVELANKK